jgi:Sulfatase
MRQQANSSRLRWYFFLTGFLVLPNLPLLLAGRSLNLLLSGYIDLDYLAIGLLSLFLPRAATFVLLLLAVLLDFIHAACATYLFSPSEFIHSMLFGDMLSTTRLGTIVGAFVLVVLLCLLATACTSRHGAERQRRVALAAALALMLVLPLLQSGATREALLGREHDGAATTLLRMPTLSLFHRQRIYERYERGDRLANVFAMPSASALALNHLHDAANSSTQKQLPNFVQILVESWGFAKDTALRQALLAPYSDPRLLSWYEVLEGTMPFQGPTTSGEARELCQSHLGFNASHGSVNQMQHCLPMRLRGMGYTTLAVHGFKGAMFDRQVWYPEMGFQDIWFQDRLHAMGMADCPGPFPGTCDAFVAAWLGDRLAHPQPSPLFVHWVTLNSHLPVPVPAPLKNPASCATSAATRNDAEICSWYQLVSAVHDSVREMALKPLSRPTIFVIVGDHAPPFDTQATRSQFSATDVPYVILLPKSHSGGSRFGN